MSASVAPPGDPWTKTAPGADVDVLDRAAAVDDRSVQVRVEPDIEPRG